VKDPVAVVGGTHADFEGFLRGKDRENYVYVYAQYVTFGRWFSDVVKVGDEINWEAYDAAVTRLRKPRGW
jgi:hypothetical protein